MSSTIHFFKSINYSTTEKIIPKFRSWEGLKIAEKVSEFVKDLLKTLCCITLVAPLLTLCYDLIARKPLPVKEVVSESPTVVPKSTNARIYSFLCGQLIMLGVSVPIVWVLNKHYYM